MTRVIAVAGPSGAGKDMLIAMACAACPDLRAARRVITRPSDAGGEDFEGVTPAEFDRRLNAGEFALHWRAHGLGYAIPQAQVQGPGTVLINLSRAMLADAAARFAGLRVLIVTAPAPVLAARLAGRGRETTADQARRLDRADLALPPGISAHQVINDGTPEQGLARFLAALQPVRS